MSLEHAILGLLSDKPSSGYDLKTRCFDGYLSPLWTADQAQIYRTLDRLRESRLVSVTRKRQTGRPDRRIYEITRAGVEALDTWLETPLPPPPHRDPFLLQLYFGAGSSDAALLGVLEARRAMHQSSLARLRSGAEELGREHSLPDRDQTLRQTAFDGAILREHATIDWLNDCILAIRDGALAGSETGGTGQRHLFGG